MGDEFELMACVCVYRQKMIEKYGLVEPLLKVNRDDVVLTQLTQA